MKQLLDDLLWSWRMFKVRRYRRNLLFARRLYFDETLRRPVQGGTVMYPDAIYEARVDDFQRAKELTDTANQTNVKTMLEAL